MTRKQYRAIITSKAYKSFMVVLSDHVPNHPERYTERITLELGTKIAPMWLAAYVIRSQLPSDFFANHDDLLQMSR